jgi:hypothetical protein
MSAIALSAGHDVTLRTLHDRREFVPFGVGNAKLGHGFIEILAESDPLPATSKGFCQVSRNPIGKRMPRV